MLLLYLLLTFSADLQQSQSLLTQTKSFLSLILLQIAAVQKFSLHLIIYSSRCVEQISFYWANHVGLLVELTAVSSQTCMPDQFGKRTHSFKTTQVQQKLRPSTVFLLLDSPCRKKKLLPLVIRQKITLHKTQFFHNFFLFQLRCYIIMCTLQKIDDLGHLQTERGKLFLPVWSFFPTL